MSTTAAILADPHAVRLKLIRPTENLITISVETLSTVSSCPRCQHKTNKVHSSYTRTVADLPWQGVAVRLQLHTRRFFCVNDICPQRVFCARLPTVVARYAPRMSRLEEALTVIAFAPGGAAGARAAGRLQFRASPSSLLRRIRRTTPVAHPTPRVLGVDDWAKRKGQTYDTILVNLERRRFVDLFPDREGETLTAWLKSHPGVEIISRDRASAYADGARAGPPDVIQVADRWHLLKNPGEVLERFFSRRQPAIRHACAQVQDQHRASSAQKVVSLLLTRNENAQAILSALRERSGEATMATRQQLDRRERRRTRYLEVVRLQEAGLSTVRSPAN